MSGRVLVVPMKAFSVCRGPTWVRVLSPASDAPGRACILKEEKSRRTRIEANFS